MKHNVKRILAALLALCMILGALPTSVFAASDTGDTSFRDWLSMSNAAEVPLTQNTVLGSSIAVPDSDEYSLSICLHGFDLSLASDSEEASLFTISGRNVSVYAGTAEAGNTATITAPTSGTAFDLSGGSLTLTEGLTIVGGAYGVKVASGATLNITGGTISGTAEALNVGHGATVSITGGTFSSDVSAYCAPGYQAVANTDGTYTVKQKDCTVEFYADGVLVKTFDVKGGEKITVPAVPAKDGYTGAWEGIDAGTTELTVAESKSYTATYTAKSYTWTATGNTVNASGTATFLGTFEVPAYEGAVETGKAFLAWSGSDSHFYLPGEAVYTYADDLTLTPIFDSDTDINTQYWIVKFALEDGSVWDVVLVEAAEDAVLALPAKTPTKTGYSFLGWYLDNTKAVEGDALTGDVTYTAKWQASRYEVLYERLDGNSSFRQYVMFGNSWTPFNYETLFGDGPDGKNFLGWADQFGGFYQAGKVCYFKTASGIRLRPVFEDDTSYWFISYVANGSVFATQAYEQTSDAVLTLPAEEPTREGYNFTGWYKEVEGAVTTSDGGVTEEPSEPTRVKVKNGDAVTDNATYTAGWYQRSYNVEISDSNTADDAIIKLSTDATDGKAAMGDKITITVDSIADGYDAAYIYVKYNNGYTAPLTKISANEYRFTMPAYAVWIYAASEKQDNLVNFTVDGELYAFAYVATGDKATMPATEPSKVGYTFTGWKLDGDDTLYQAGASGAVVAAGGATYTATWEQNTYSITTNDSADGHVTLSSSTATASCGESVAITVTAAAGYETYYIYAITSGESKPVPMTKTAADAYAFVMPADDVEVYVTEKPINNTVQFIVDGELYALSYVESGKAPTAPVTNPTKDGYTFTGWTAASDGTFYADGEDFAAILADETYTAEFEQNTYSLTYYRGKEADNSEYKCFLTLSSGVVVEFFNNDTTNMPTYQVPDELHMGDKVTLGTPSLPGYNFLYWVDEEGYQHPAGSTFTMPDRNVLLTAVWEIDEDECMVLFMNNGMVYDLEMAAVGTNVSIPAIDPSENGKTFAGWMYGEGTDAKIYSHDGVSEFEVVADDNMEMVLTAVWKEELYSITYEVEGADAPADVTDILYGTQIVLADAPKREGYTFVAWQDANNGAYYGAKAAVEVKKDMKLVAVWSEDTVEYVVKFFDEKGNLIDLYVVEKDETITAPAYEQGRADAKYEWRDAENHKYLSAGDKLKVDANYNFKAVLIDETEYEVLVTVSPKNDDTSNATSLDSQKYKMDEIVCVSIDVPEGYILKNVDAVTQHPVASVKSSLIHVKDNEYKFVFEMPAGNVDVQVEFEKIPAGKSAVKFMVDGELFGYVVVTKGDNGTAPAAPSKDGWSFQYWQCGNYTVDAGAQFAVASDADDVIVYEAVFNQNSYLVSYDPASGTPTPITTSAVYGEEIKLADAPTRDGYVFIGWVEDSTGFVYGAGASYTVRGNVTFTAKWEQGECIVRFVDPNTGIIYGYEPINQGGTVVAPAAPVVSGKTFIAWVNADNDADRVDANAETRQLYTNTVYHATYKTSEYNIAFDGSNCTASGIPTGAVAVGTDVTFEVTPAQDYVVTSVILTYTDGLSTVIRELFADENGEYSFVMPNANVEVSAIAKQNVYSVFTDPSAESKIDIMGGNKHEVGKTVTFGVKVTDDNYVLQSVYVLDANGNAIPVTVYYAGTAPIYMFTMPESDVTIHTQTVKAEYTVTFLDSDNTILDIVSVNSGELATAPTATKDGYTFTGWEILPGKAAFDPQTDAVTKNLVVRAVYVGEEQTVAAGKVDHVAYLKAECTVSSGNENSSDLLLSEKLLAETGKTVYFTVAAKYDWIVKEIAVVSAEGTNLVVSPTLRKIETKDNLVYYTYAFEMPAENVLIDVYTAPKPFKVSVTENIDAGGKYTINGNHTNNLMILQGEQVAIEVTANAGYEIVDVTGTYVDNLGNTANLGGVWDGTAYTFTMIAKDVEISIVYKAIDYTVEIEESNFASYKPDASKNPAVVVESLDPELTSKGILRFVGGADRDYTNAKDQIYKIPANGTANVGSRIAFTVEEFTGYNLDSLTVTYDNGEQTCPLTEKNGVYYFDMPAYDVTITATFVEETYTVTKDSASEAHGKVTMNGLIENIISADYKDEVTVTVTPEAGYQITKIYYTLDTDTVMDFDAAVYTPATVITDDVDTAHSITFHMPASDVKVFVEYAAIDYSITDVCGEAELTYSTPQHVGEQVIFETEAHYGYHIKNVTVINNATGKIVEHHTSSTSQIDGAKYTFTMPASSVTIHVETIKIEYNVTYVDYGGAYIASENIDYLDTANVSAHVDDVVNGKPGYHFVGWTSADVQTPVTAPSVTNDDFVIVKDTIIRAAYEKDEIDVFFTATENGTVTELFTDDNNTAEYRLTTTVFGDKVSFTAVPDEGYVVKTVSVTTTDGEGFNQDIRTTVSGDKYTFMIPASYKDNVHLVQAEDVVVTVTFEKDTFTLTKAADCETDGEITVNGEVDTETTHKYLYQDAVSITATPKAGYYVASITAVCADGEHKYTALGSKPAADTAVGDALTLAFKMPACDLTYTVDYEKIDYTITTVFNAEQGNVSTDPADIAQIDDIVTVTVTPKTGYELVSLTVTYANGEKSCVLTETAENVYTFTMPTDGVTVTAIFDEVAYNVNLKVEGEAYVSLNGGHNETIKEQYLDTVTIGVTPKAGWELVSITVDGGNVKVNEAIKPAGGNYTFTMPNHDVQVEVKLEKTGFDMTTYALNFFESGHGTVTLDPKDKAYVGDRIILTADPDDGYRVNKVVVVDKNGNAVPVSYISGTAGYVETWSFTMPACDVKIVVYFTLYGSSYYTDVRTDHWFFNAVTFVTDRGYFYGISDDLFAPFMEMDRAMLVSVLGRISGVDTSKYTSSKFTDVDPTHWYGPYVAWAQENGIVFGRTETTFAPHENITREEIAAIMYRYSKFLGNDMTIENEPFMDRYVDTGDISPWAKESVEWAVGVGLILGTSENTIDPQGLATRAQVAQMVKNLCDKVIYE